MHKKSLVIMLIASLMALILAPSLTDLAVAQELDVDAKMRKAIENTAVELGWNWDYRWDTEFNWKSEISGFYTPEVEDYIGNWGIGDCDVTEDLSVNIDINMFRSVKQALADFEWEPSLHRSTVTTFSDYPAKSYYLYWADTPEICARYYLMWACGRYWSYVHVSSGDPEVDAKDAAYTIAGVLLDKVEKEGLLAIAFQPRNLPPAASFDVYPGRPTPDESVECVSRSTDPEYDQLTYEWYMDDEYLGCDWQIELGKLEAGRHTITLCVNDGDGGTDEYSVNILVAEDEEQHPSNGGMGCAKTSYRLAAGHFDISPFFLGIGFVPLVVNKYWRRKRK